MTSTGERVLSAPGTGPGRLYVWLLFAPVAALIVANWRWALGALAIAVAVILASEALRSARLKVRLEADRVRLGRLFERSEDVPLRDVREVQIVRSLVWSNSPGDQVRLRLHDGRQVFAPLRALADDQAAQVKMRDAAHAIADSAGVPVTEHSEVPAKQPLST